MDTDGKAKYISRYGADKPIHAAQFIAEIMCERIASQKDKDLPVKFWNHPTWKRTFMMQLRQANGLLKLYSDRAIIRALNSKDGKKIYSLSAKWLDDLIKQEEVKLSRERPVEEPTPVVEQTTRRQPFIGKKSTIDKLRDLDE